MYNNDTDILIGNKIFRFPSPILKQKIGTSEVASFSSLLGVSVAPIVGGQIPTVYLPSYVDDVLEYANILAFPTIGETAKIYIDLSTGEIYRWSGTIYVELSDKTAIWGFISGNITDQPDLLAALNSKYDASNPLNFETPVQLNTRDTNNRSRANHTGTQLASTISNFQSTVSLNADVAANTSARHTHSNKTILDLITEAFTTALKSAYDNASAWVVANGTSVLNHLSNTSNPHSTTKAQVGLGNADNTSDLNKPVSNATQTALNDKANLVGANTYSGGNQTYLDATLTPRTSIVDGYVKAPTPFALLDAANKQYVDAADAAITSALANKANVSGQVFTGAISATNLSNTNTGDETTATIQSKRPLKTINGNSLEGSGNIVISGGGGSPGGSTTQLQYNNAGAFAGISRVETDGNDLIFTNVQSVPTPSAGKATQFYGSIGNKSILSSKDSNGSITKYQKGFYSNKVAIWNPPGNATTVPVVFGMGALTAVGTVTARNISTTNLLTRSKRLAYVSVATAAGFSSVRSTAIQYSTGTGTGLGGFTAIFQFGVTDVVVGARTFVGMRNIATAPTNIEPNTVTNQIGVAQLSTDGTQYYIVYGGSVTQTEIATGVPITFTDLYELSLHSPSNVTGTVYWVFTNLSTGVTNSGTLAGIATILPQSGTLLAPILWRTNNASLSAVTLEVCNIYLQHED